MMPRGEGIGMVNRAVRRITKGLVDLTVRRSRPMRRPMAVGDAATNQPVLAAAGGGWSTSPKLSRNYGRAPTDEAHLADD